MREIKIAEGERAAIAARIAAEEKAAKDFQDRKNKRVIVEPPPPLTEDEAIVLIQVTPRHSHLNL